MQNICGTARFGTLLVSTRQIAPRRQQTNYAAMARSARGSFVSFVVLVERLKPCVENVENVSLNRTISMHPKHRTRLRPQR
jgi:hypothetical protein